MFNEDEIKGKWKEIKGEIKKKWGELTDDEVERTKGNATSLIGLVQQKLGLKKEEANQHLTDLAQKWRTKAENVGKKVSDSANAQMENTKNKLK